MAKGRGIKGKGKQDKRQNNKFKQRSAENMKQLKKLEGFTNRDIKGGRGDSKGGRGGRGDSRGGQRDARGSSRDKNNFRSNSTGGFGKNNKGRNDRSYSQGDRDNKNNKAKYNNNNNKTKQIKKFNKKNPFKNDSDGESEQMNITKHNTKNNKKHQLPVIKGNPLFKIVTQGMYSDDFAAIGGCEEEEEFDDEGDYDKEEEEGEFDEEEQGEDAEEIQNEQGEEDEQNNQQMFSNQALQNEDEQEMDQEQDGQQFEDEQDQQQQIQGQYNEEQGQGQEDEQEFNDEQKPEQGDQGQGQQQGQQGEQEQENSVDSKQPVDISVLSLKIQQTIQILMNVQKLGNGKPRKYHLEQLKKMIHQYYGYNFELINHFLDFLNPAEMVQFFESNETQRPLTIRTNTLKTRRKQLAQSLIQRGVNLDPLAEWSKVGIKIYETKVPIGATPEYLAGQYMLQSASSLLPVIALDPQVGEKVLDMASAPGGKTTYIAQMMKNTGCIFANDLKKERLRALQFNLYRLGITNTAVTCRDGRKFPAIFPSTFDRVLLDAPCTGLGIISKDLSIKANRILIDIYKCSHLQKQLLLAAIDCCKVNGTVVYSTCSVSPLENEEVVNYALKRRFIKIVDCGVEVGEEGLTKFVDKRFHVDLKKTRRIYPHVHNMDGFYFAKIIKIGKGKKQVDEEQQKVIIQ